VYSGHAWWEGRQATAGYYDECIRRGVHEHWDRKRIGLSWQQCPGTLRPRPDVSTGPRTR
jgi:hypothetical protein